MPHASDGDMYRNVCASRFADAVVDPEFLRGDHVILIKNAKKLPGFENPLKREHLADSVAVKNVLGNYPHPIRVRRYNKGWKVRMRGHYFNLFYNSLYY